MSRAAPREAANMKARRTANACVACRQSKIKCSGDEPCSNCQRRLLQCHFADSPNSVVVSRQYLRDLHNRARGDSVMAPNDGRPSAPSSSAVEPALSQTQPGHISPPSSIAVAESPQDNRDTGPSFPSQAPTSQFSAGVKTRPRLTIWTNPFAFPSKTIKNPDENSRTWLWLAPWSTWSFTVRLTLMLMVGLRHDDTDMSSTSATDTIYPMTWKQIPEDEPSDLSGLPPLDQAIYLFNTAKFHLGQHYRFFTDGSFEAQVHAFYRGDTRSQQATPRLWLSQFFVVLAFGTAFLSKSRHPGEAPGSKYFVRAMSLLPPMASVWKGALQACETLALVGLFFYSTNHREAALLHVGQALRIAQLEGLHTQLPEDDLGIDLVKRCRSLWCTLWIMDRHISTSLGLSMSTADCDFLGILGQPAISSDEDTVVILQAKLSQLMWDILHTLYQGDRTELGVFLEKTRSILQTLAGHAQEIEHIIALKFGGSLDTVPKGMRHITLLYHQCVIVATRPLLYSVLKERLDGLNSETAGPDNFENFLALTTTLISTGINSATKTLQILSRENALFASFLPFDLEFTHGAALHLIMARAIFPCSDEDAEFVQQARDILEEMISNGNEVAKVRKQDLNRLEQLCREFARKSEQQGMQTLILPDPEPLDLSRESTSQSQPNDVASAPRPVAPGEQAATPLVFSEYLPETSLHHHNMMESSTFMDDIGISSDAFFLIADQMAEMGGADFAMQDVAGFIDEGPHVIQ